MKSRLAVRMRALLLVMLGAGVLHSQAQTAVNWTGGTGNWNLGSNWSDGVVPNNGGGKTYNATVGSGSAAETVTLNLGVTVSDLTLGTTGGNGVTLQSVASDSLTIASGGTFTISNSGTLLFNTTGSDITVDSGGTLNNNGTLELAAAGETLKVTGTTNNKAGASLYIENGSSATFTGNLSNSGTFNTVGGNNTVTVTGALNNATGALLVIYGDGDVLNVTGTTTNAGTLAIGEYYGSGTANFSSVSNSGTFETSNTGNGNNTITVSGTFSNASGATLELGASGDVMNVNALSNSGTLTINPGATLDLTGTGTQSNTGTISVDGTLGLKGTVSNSGSIAVNGATLSLSGNLTLNGKGTVVLSNSATNLITASKSGFKLTNDSTIEGSGTIKKIGIINNGTIAANQSTALIILPSSAGLNNKGTLSVSAGDTMEIGTSTGGALLNYSGTTLTGGTYAVSGTLEFGASGTSVVTDAANITLTGAGAEIVNFAGENVLTDLATIASTGSFTIGSGANFTTAGNLTNDGKLTVNSGTTLTVTGSLTNLASGTLTGGTYTVGGTLQLASSNGGITTNAASLTLTGTSAEILDGTANALAGFNNNTGTLALASSATLTTASSAFSNSGTVDIAKGTTLTVGGTGNAYNQTSGTTTVDGTLVGKGTTGLSVTGGTIQGAGTLKANVSIGGSGTTPTINVGDAGKAGLLSITGKYTQLSTGTMTGLVNGTTAGTGFSELKVTGAASLAGTINFTVATAFQASLTVGETFTVLTAKSVTGTFSNSTIAINGTFQFNVSYTATGVVLTVADVPPSGSNNQSHAAETAIASAKLAVVKVSRPLVVAGWRSGTGHSPAMVAGGNEWNKLRSWERPIVFAGQARMGAAAAPLPRAENESRVQSLGTRKMGIGAVHGNRMGVGGWIGMVGNRHVPVKIQRPMLPRMSR